MLQELELQVLELYQVLDVAVAGFSARSGLSCPEGCGHCCSSEKVEATILECIPLAFELFRTLQAELILKRLEKSGANNQCVLYRPDFTAAGKWGCTQYRHRAVVCRLFGFAGNRDRNNIPRLAMCRVMKKAAVPGEPAIETEGMDGSMPLFMEAGMRITALHPGLGRVRLPINMALREALMKVGMILDLTAPTITSETGNPQQPPDKPLFPRTTLGQKAA